MADEEINDHEQVVWFVVLIFIIAVLIGCICAAYKSDIQRYASNFSGAFTSTFSNAAVGTASGGNSSSDGSGGSGGSGSNVGLTKEDRFKVPLIDETDMKYIKAIVPSETLEDVARNISDVEYVADPNAPIENKELLKSSEYNYGTDMPWDRDVSPCEVLKNTDQDLYADVQDTRSIIIY